MNVSFYKVLCSFLILTFLHLHSFAESKDDKAIRDRKKKILEIKREMEKEGSEPDYYDKVFETFVRRAESEMFLKKCDYEYDKLLKDGKLAIFEDFYKTVPEKLLYKPTEAPGNSYKDLIIFCDKYTWPRFKYEHENVLKKIEAFEKVSSKEVREIRAILKKQEAFYLQVLDILKNRPFIFTPETLDPSTSDLGFFRDISKFLSHSALIKFREGKKDSAINLVKAGLSLALRLEQRKGPVTDILVLHSMKGIVTHRATWILSQKYITEAQIHSLQNLFENSNNFETWENAFKYELFFSAKILITNPMENIFDTEITDEEKKEAREEISKLPHANAKEKEILNKILDDCDAFMKEKSLNKQFLKYYSQVLTLTLEDIRHFPASEAKKSRTFLEDEVRKKDNYFWELVLRSLQYHNLFIRKNAYAQNNTAALNIIAAFRLHEIRRHGPPNNLEDLVQAGLLKEIPLDRWTGKPIKMNPTKRSISLIHYIKGLPREIKF